MNNKIIVLFTLLATSFVVSTFIKPYPFSWAFKLLPIILLLGVAWQSFKNKAVSGKLFVAGLAFSACGDFILDYNQEHWFIFGLGAFFIAHIFYLASLKPYVKSLKQAQYSISFVLYIIYGTAMLWLLSSNLGELFIPVVAYMVILLLMALATVFSEKSNGWLIAGGISFVISDSLLGFNKFYMPVAQADVLIMVSYYFAQFSLLMGFIKAYRFENK